MISYFNRKYTYYFNFLFCSISVGKTEDEQLLEQYLNKTVNRDESGIRLQDCLYIFRVISANKIGRNVAMNWMNKYYDTIIEAFGADGGNAGGGEGFARFASTIIDGNFSLNDFCTH